MGACMNWLLSVLVAASCAMAVVAQAPNENSTAARRERLKARFRRSGNTMRTNPEFATAVGDNRYNDRLSDYSAEFLLPSKSACAARAPDFRID